MIADDYTCKLAAIDSLTNEESEGYVNFLWEEVSYIRSCKIGNANGTLIDGSLICMKNGDNVPVFESPDALARVRRRWLAQGRFAAMN